jgi:hypothetical protein
MGKDGLSVALSLEKIETCYGYSDNSDQKSEYSLFEFEGRISSFSASNFSFAENCSISDECFSFSLETQDSVRLFETDHVHNTVGFIHFSKNQNEISIRRIALQLENREFDRLQLQMSDNLKFEPIFLRKDKKIIIEVHSDAEIYAFIRRMYLTKIK